MKIGASDKQRADKKCCRMDDARTIEGDLDLALAGELQAALLPKACPQDCPNHVAAAKNRMCAGVGGDFYNFLRINDEQIVFLIGDVVGHGVRASLVMAQIMGLLQSKPKNILSRPRQIVITLNKMLIELGDRLNSVLSCSLLYGVIDTPTGAGFFVNAGHQPPFICDRRKSEFLNLGSPDLLLGIEEYSPAESCHAFRPGERLVMFTDGIIEAMNPTGERFGDERLHEVVGEHLSSNPESCAEGVFRAVEKFRRNAQQTDDETIVVIDWI